jgi:ribose transport system ATP-binding protein
LISALSASALVEAPGVAALPFAGGLGACCALGGLVQMRKLPAIIVTLGASFIWSGIAYTLQPTPGGSRPQWLTAAIGWSSPNVATSLVVLLLIAFAAFVIDRTPFGVSLRAFGANPGAMSRAGCPAPQYGRVDARDAARQPMPRPP